MKKHILIIMLLAITGSTFGVIFGQFRSWSDLNSLSSDVIIARCTATPGFNSPKITGKIILVSDVAQSSIEILKVLKGDTKPGFSQMNSFYRPYQGEMFLVFVNHMTSGTNTWYNAIEEYRIIPLNHDFRIGDLNGKPFNEQIQLILASRIKDLDDEVARDKEEKTRLESGLIK